MNEIRYEVKYADDCNRKHLAFLTREELEFIMDRYGVISCVPILPTKNS